MVLGLLCACAQTRVYRDERVSQQTGVRFYDPKPYLAVKRDAICPQKVQASLLLLPDLEHPRYVREKAGAGTSSYKLTLVGGMLAEFTQGLDSKIAENLNDANKGITPLLQSLLDLETQRVTHAPPAATTGAGATTGTGTTTPTADAGAAAVEAARVGAPAAVVGAVIADLRATAQDIRESFAQEPVSKTMLFADETVAKEAVRSTAEQLEFLANELASSPRRAPRVAYEIAALAKRIPEPRAQGSRYNLAKVGEWRTRLLAAASELIQATVRSGGSAEAAPYVRDLNAVAAEIRTVATPPTPPVPPPAGSTWTSAAAQAALGVASGLEEAADALRWDSPLRARGVAVLILFHAARLPAASTDGKPYSDAERTAWVRRVQAVAQLLYRPPADPCAGVPAEVCEAALVAAEVVDLLYNGGSPPVDPKEAVEPALAIALQLDLLARALRAGLAPDEQATGAAIAELAARFPLPSTGRMHLRAPDWKMRLNSLASALRQKSLPSAQVGPVGADLVALASEITAAVAYDIAHGTLLVGTDQIALIKDVVDALVRTAFSFRGCRGEPAGCAQLALTGLKSRLPMPLQETADQRLSRYNGTVVAAWNSRISAVAEAAGKLAGDKPCGSSEAIVFELYEIQNDCGKTILVRVPEPEVIPLLRCCAAVETLQAPSPPPPPPPLPVPPPACPCR